MSEESKTTYLFGDTRNTLDPNLMLAMNGGNGGFGGNGFNNPFWALILLAFLRNGNGFGFGGNDNGNTGFVASQLGQAIAGNANAISNLATHLDCSIGQVQSGLNALQSSICSVGNQLGMSTAQIVNAVNSGDCAITNQISSCCCELKDSITKQGYEAQLATLNQTNVLGGKIDAQTTFLSDKFCELEKREMQNKIDALREANSTLKGQIDNANQTAQITGYINSVVTPLAQEIAGIKCKLPETVNVPYSPVTAIPTCVAFNNGLYGFGNGVFSNGQWA